MESGEVTTPAIVMLEPLFSTLPFASLLCMTLMGLTTAHAAGANTAARRKTLRRVAALARGALALLRGDEAWQRYRALRDFELATRWAVARAMAGLGAPP